MAINLAEKYSPQVDERFKLGSLTEGLINRNYEFVGVSTVKVYSIPTVAMNDYARTGTDRYGTPTELQDTVQEMTLSKDRSFTFTVDKGNDSEQLGVKNAGKALRRQIDEVVIPEKDTYRIGVLSAAAIANDSYASTEITTSNAYAAFLAGQEKLDDAKVPTAGRVSAVTPSFYNKIKQDDSFTKACDLAYKNLINGQVGEIDGVKIVKMPASYFPAGTEFIICHPSACTSPDKLTEYKTHDNPPGINGMLVEGRVIYDAFVLESKKDAIYTHITTLESV